MNSPSPPIEPLCSTARSVSARRWRCRHHRTPASRWRVTSRAVSTPGKNPAARWPDPARPAPRSSAGPAENAPDPPRENEPISTELAMTSPHLADRWSASWQMPSATRRWSGCAAPPRRPDAPSSARRSSLLSRGCRRPKLCATLCSECTERPFISRILWEI